ncbi:hypothetical protein MHH37_06345 [Solibacillus sp. FSL K6-1781]|uniref:hypothetical protein n=1 Tax=Solibacillus sp. FSL K6-1781 TaxID=2921474 RepID=UPI00315A9983
MVSKKPKIERNFLDSLYRQYSPKQSKEDLEIALKCFEVKDSYEKKMIIAKLKYLYRVNTMESGFTGFTSIFTLFLSTVILYFNEIIGNKYIKYIIIIYLFIYIFHSFNKVINKNRVIVAETEYLLALLEEK